jgi:hypothetical protein
MFFTMSTTCPSRFIFFKTCKYDVFFTISPVKPGGETSHTSARKSMFFLHTCVCVRYPYSSLIEKCIEVETPVSVTCRWSSRVTRAATAKRTYVCARQHSGDVHGMSIVCTHVMTHLHQIFRRRGG